MDMSMPYPYPYTPVGRRIPTFRSSWTPANHDPAVALFSAMRKVSDHVLHEHENKVGRIAGLISRAAGDPAETVDTISRAASLHDIGKFAIPPAILGKKEKLGPEEIAEIHKHTVHGERILRQAGRAVDDPAVLVALHHHERYDGTGYPFGLKGDEIPREARITAIADVYDALRAARPYKGRLDHDTVMQIMLKGDGRTAPEHFDPVLLETFADIRDQVSTVWEEPVDDAGATVTRD